MGQDIQPECEGDRGRPEGAEEGQEGEIVLYEVCLSFLFSSLFFPFSPAFFSNLSI